MADAPSSSGGRSQTALRLVAIASVMAACLMGAIGLSALQRRAETAVAEVQTRQDGIEPPAPAVERPSDPAPPFEIGTASTPATPSTTPRDNSPSPAPAGPGYNASPTYGQASLRGGFTPDPYIVEVQAGGPVPASTSSSACTGFVARTADFRLRYQSNALPLTFSVQSSADTVLLINTPTGTWLCDDDSGGGVNPRIRIAEPASGDYDVWVGTAARGPVERARLSISETQ